MIEATKKGLVVSDLHFNESEFKGEDERLALPWFKASIKRHSPGYVIVLGDWGDAFTEESLNEIASAVELHGLVGNHDVKNIGMLAGIKNHDGRPVLMRDGEIRNIGGIRFGAINGIPVRGRKIDNGLTMKSVERYIKIATGLRNRVDVLCTHASPAREDFENIFDPEATETVNKAIRIASPRLSLSGHLSPIKYEGEEIEGTTNFVLESNQKSKLYATLEGTDVVSVKLWVDRKQVYERTLRLRTDANAQHHTPEKLSANLSQIMRRHDGVEIETETQQTVVSKQPIAI